MPTQSGLTQDEYDRLNTAYHKLISQGKTPLQATDALRENLKSSGQDETGNKLYNQSIQSGTVPTAQTTKDPYFQSFDQSGYTKNFQQNADDYLKAMQGQFAKETGYGALQFSRGAQDISTNQQNMLSDYQRYTGVDQQNMNRDIAAQSKDFALKMSNAADAYGKRGILNSGVAVKQAAGDTSDYQTGITNTQNSYGQQQATLDVNKQRQSDYYNLMQSRNTESAGIYQSQRADQLATQMAGTKANLSGQYDQGLTGLYQSTEALNQANYGRKQRGQAPITPGQGGLLFGQYQ